MPTSTTNYGLIKPGTDDPILIGQLNDNMDTIDTVLKDHSDKIDAAALGIKYKGEVNYYADLPNNAEIGDAYTVKYAGSSGTTPDGTEYVWGAVSGVNQWINFSKDSYSKAEVDALLALKQNALSAAQLAAVNSDINSEKVAQIETNKNNILYAQKTGVKNIMDLSKYKELNPSIVVGDNLVFHGVTWSISNSSGLTVSGTSDSNGSYPTIYSATLPIGTYYLTGGDSTIEMLTPNNQRESGQGLTIEITSSTSQPYIIRGYVPLNTSITGTHNIKPMLRQVGDTTFEPYAMSNAELTAAIQALQAQLANQ